MANNIIQAVLDYRYVDTRSVWQYDYGQILRIQGENLPKAVEVHFSLNEVGGDSITKIGVTTDGITEVQVPDELLENGGARFKYSIYAFVYTEDGASGNTEYRVRIPVQVRPKPSDHVTPDNTDIDPFGDVVKAVNNAAERAEASEQKAKEHAARASESAVTAEKTKEDALRKVGEKKQEAIEAIQNQEETSVGKIATHTDGEIQRIQNQVAESKGELEQTIINAGVSKEELDESIQTASDTKTALDKSVELAGTAKTELDTSIRETGTAKTALDESTETAGTVQETLSATVNQAGALDTSLGEKIKTGTQLKTDLVTSGEKAVQDIQAAGSEQLGKMQAVAEAFTDDREQIATNKKDIGSLQEELGDIESKFEIETEAFSNKCSIIRNNAPNNFTGNQITGVKQYFDFGENAALTKIKMNIKASNDDTVVLEIATLDGNIIATGEKAVTTEYTDVVFDLENIVIKEPVSIFVYTKGTNLLSYGLYATPYDDQSFSYIFPDGTRKSAFKIGTSEIPKPTTSNNKQCLVLFFDYTSKIIKNISDSISQNIDTTLLKSGKAADAKVVGDKLSKLEEDIGNKAPAIIKKASGKTIIINDSSNLPIKILSGTGKIIITGKNILNIKKKNEFIPFEAKAGTLFTLITNGELSEGGNVLFTGENDENVWFAIDKGKTRVSAKIGGNVKGYKNLLSSKEGLKYCFSVGENDEYEEYVEQVITTPIDSEQLKAIHTNYPTTVLTSENEISVEYVADTEAYIEKRIKEENQSLQKQILEIQNALISQKISGV